ncbi:uncharacterized protein DFL_001244 [Arthrobotrys flagrans]|uniref:F-box domain-containing protein n=1 Tax=Arthrobotrys flagrans TaxID=97331 RepID=A0A437AGT1_ARTFL|nr:hypothetical protein DFL_001244 [Arthrobotrys flagrans]
MEFLPVELLRRIASYTPYPTIHSLSLTSHKLRAAVHDWQVYKSIIDDQIHLFAPANLKDPHGIETVSHSILKHEIHLQPWARNPITSSMAANTAARYACADYQAYNLPTNLTLWGSNLYQHPPYLKDDSDEGILRDFARWGGILAAQGHPLIRLIGHTNLHSDNGGKTIWIPGPSSPTYCYTLVFCLAAYLLSDSANLFPSNEEGEEILEDEEGTLFGLTTGFSTPQDASSLLDTTEAFLDAKWKGVLSNLAILDQGAYIVMPNGEFRMVPFRSLRSYRDIQYEGHEVPRTRAAINNSYEGSEITTEGQSYSAFTLLELCVRTVGILGWNYRRLILDGRVPRFRALRWEFGSEPTEEQAEEVKSRYDPRQLWGPPVASGIPFEKYMKLEAELGRDGAGFVWSHLEGMMNQEFLEEGRWMGFYTYGHIQEIDPAMIDIVFTVVDPKELEPRRQQDDDSDEDEEEYEDEDEEDEDGDEDGENEDDQYEGSAKGELDEVAGPEEEKKKEKRDESPDVPIIAVKATAKDGLGDFVLWGKFYPKTGKVHLTKAYYKGLESGTLWNWTAFMTPFGIVGRWGDRRFGGYIWLWKEDWYGPVEGNELANRSHHERQA